MGSARHGAHPGAGGRADARERAMEVLGEGVTRGRVSVPRLVSLLMQ